MTPEDKNTISSQGGPDSTDHSQSYKRLSHSYASEREKAFDRELEKERERLTHRPTLHIRTRITVAFLVVFAEMVRMERLERGSAGGANAIHRKTSEN